MSIKTCTHNHIQLRAIKFRRLRFAEYVAQVDVRKGMHTNLY